MAEETLFDLVHRHFPAQLLLDRCHLGPGEPARNDPAKVGQVRVHVQRHTVIGDSSPHRDTDGGDFPLSDPDARPRRSSLSCQPEAAENTDRYHLDISQVTVHVFSQLGSEIQQGIDDRLAGAVVGDIAAPAGSMNRHLSRGKDIGLLATPAEGEDMRMLDEQEKIGQPFPSLGCQKPLL